MIELIEALATLAGPAGAEEAVAAEIGRRLQETGADLRHDALGNLYALYEPAQEPASGQTIMVVAHMDEPGLVALDCDDQGRIRFDRLGNLPAAAQLVGQRVKFARTGVVGVIGAESDVASSELEYRHLYVDLGATERAQGEAAVRIGDAAALNLPVMRGLGDAIIGHALDNRVAVAVLIETLRALKSRHRIVAVFTSQHGVGSRGAQVAGFRTAADVAIAVGVSPASDAPGGRQELKVGAGPGIVAQDGRMVVAQRLREWLLDCAQAVGVSAQMQVTRGSSSDAGALLLARAGMPSCAVTIPARYVGTASQLVSLADVTQAVQLLTHALTV
jgi:endoglucanase